MVRPPSDDDGMLVYPKLPVPKGRPSDPGDKLRNSPFEQDSSNKKKWILGIAAGTVVGGILGFVLKPSKSADLDKATTDLAAAQKSASSEKERADGLQKMYDVVQKDKADTQKQLDDLQAKASEVDKKAADAEALQKKLEAAVGKDNGTVSTEGNEIHLKLVDKVLFATGDDQLTKNGQAVLDKVAATLKEKELANKAIWVQGHTDEQPIYPRPSQKPKTKSAKGAKPDPAPHVETNWELGAYRALNVVHYLQDTDKIDPRRLAAVSFGQWHPISRNLASNRRIEIVLFPRREVLLK